eukprot:CAMPEP_0170430474 /NCGR_PEP_ID=MMETSP0117_2-20130122/40874_1 /TAXON_ID=400756 /ORGANISM="Durinskia baltica, Strain CSIRO CS-38" /LENGTH=76 /DNA_ID=CAMNT_0010689939 /DNA_START=12 /DNA_END=238 /DNA_ORIENTATION=+
MSSSMHCALEKRDPPQSRAAIHRLFPRAYAAGATRVWSSLLQLPAGGAAACARPWLPTAAWPRCRDREWFAERDGA